MALLLLESRIGNWNLSLASVTFFVLLYFLITPSSININVNDHYHGFGKELFIKAIDSIDSPKLIFKKNNCNDYIIITTLKDQKNNVIIIPIEVETYTISNRNKCYINRIKTIYGYNANVCSLNNYIKRSIKLGIITKIYEQKKEQGTGLIPAASSLINNIH